MNSLTQLQLNPFTVSFWWSTTPSV